MAFFKDLVGSTAQPAPRRTEHHRGPRVGSPGTGVGDQGWPENGGYELGQPLHVSGQSQLIQGNLGSSELRMMPSAAWTVVLRKKLVSVAYRRLARSWARWLLLTWASWSSWVRQENPSASTTASLASRTAGSRAVSATARDTS